MKISVIIPVYNEEGRVGSTIESLLDQKFKNYEIIAVNDASKDQSIDVLRKYKDKIKIIDKKKNEGQASAVNSGLEIASGDIIARTDADSLVAPDWLERINNDFKDKEVVAVGGWLDVANKGSYWALANSFKDAVFNGFLRKSVTPNILPGANTAIRASAFRAVGGYPTKNSYYSEDFQLYSKLSKIGKVIKDDKLVIRTYYPDSIKGSIKRKYFWGMAGAPLFGRSNTLKFYMRPLYYTGLIVSGVLALALSLYWPALSLLFAALFVVGILPMTAGLFLVAAAYIVMSKNYKYLKVLPTTLFYPFLLEFVYFCGLLRGLMGGKVRVWRET